MAARLASLLCVLLLGMAPAGAANKRGKAKAGKGTTPPAGAAADPSTPPASPEEARRPPSKGREEDDRELRRGDRVEFDGRLIEGQTAAQGAIYLFERLPSELRSMVLERRSFRTEVLETLYPGGVAPAQSERSEKSERPQDKGR